jgi:sulfonate transport system substrate-binding protein
MRACASIVASGRSYSVTAVDKAALAEQRAIADTFFEEGLIPKKIITADAHLWRPAKADHGAKSR